jgi:hypothetical protein
MKITRAILLAILLSTLNSPAVNTTSSTISSPGSGTTDPFANLRY